MDLDRRVAALEARILPIRCRGSVHVHLGDDGAVVGRTWGAAQPFRGPQDDESAEDYAQAASEAGFAVLASFERPIGVQPLRFQPDWDGLLGLHRRLA